MNETNDINTMLTISKETIETLRGLTEALYENLKQIRNENEELIFKINELENENNRLHEKLLKNTYEESFSDDEETIHTLSKNLLPYYKDLSLYHEKHISLEDGERLYHTIKYIFKQLKKAGIDL